MINILIVDDEDQVRNLEYRTLSRHGYVCTTASSGEEAIKCLQDNTFEMAICDVIMPGMSGLDLLRHIRIDYPDTAVIMVTGMDDPKIADTVIKAGTYGYLTKPFNPNELIINVKNVLRLRQLEITHRLYRSELEQKVAERTIRLRKAMGGIIQAMALAVEARDPYTAGHQRRVGQIAVGIAEKLNLSQNQIEGIRTAGLIHDLGKISIPAEILSKPSKLTDIEFAFIKTHPQVGYDILKEIDFPWPIAAMVLQHHEKIDGSGYPNGLKGKDILFESRIICVADVVEAISSHRPYRPALGTEIALEEIAKNKATLFDPDAVNACLILFKKGFKLS